MTRRGRRPRAGRRSRADRCDRGAASLMTLALAGVLLWLGAALAVVAAVVVAHRANQAAADLAALAGAQAAGSGADACGAASSVALANGARLASCTVTGREVRVRVTTRAPQWWVPVDDLEAEARAGPTS
ncbi:MAG: hypothetical protein CMH83_11190 [Nocardioides sp.]|nr:hypothetical protein [Nocardioides sp.]